VPEARYLRKMIHGVPVVAAPAEIDITTAEQLGAVLLQAAGAGQPVVVDMTRTRFCDSAGIHAVLRARKRAVADDGEVRLVVPADGAVCRVLALTGLDRLIPCFPSLESALAQTPAAATRHSLGTGRRISVLTLGCSPRCQHSAPG